MSNGSRRRRPLPEADLNCTRRSPTSRPRGWLRFRVTVAPIPRRGSARPSRIRASPASRRRFTSWTSSRGRCSCCMARNDRNVQFRDSLRLWDVLLKLGKPLRDGGVSRRDSLLPPRPHPARRVAAGGGVLRPVSQERRARHVEPVDVIAVHRPHAVHAGTQARGRSTLRRLDQAAGAADAPREARSAAG